jgi:hypothetical protein
MLIDWIWKAASGCFFIAFFIFIIVGLAHGGKVQMSVFDPALKNEISPFGKKCLLIGAIFIALSIVLFVLSAILVS